MPYVRAVTRAGNTLIIEKYYTSRWNRKGIRRGENCRKTPEGQERCNHRKAVRKLTVLLNANFGPADYHLVLDYRPGERPGTAKEAKAAVGRFIRKLRRLYRKEGVELKYVEACEYGKNGGLHHHLAISGGVPPEAIREKWPHGRAHFTPLDGSGEYSRLASYMLKSRKYWREAGGTGRQYSRSRGNLAVPETVVTVIRTAGGYYEKPRVRKGWVLSPGTDEAGTTEEGWPYVRYILVKDRKARGRERRGP